ncbi:MAG: heme ABC exporter ATP-binding protein CcmA [Acetobacteraceae bacterium]
MRTAGVLQAEKLAAIRGERLIFRDLSFTLGPGDALLVRGPNGAGKSTLLRVLAGLLRPAAGRLLWDGADALDDPPLHARRLAYLGHQDAVKAGLTGAENLRFAGLLSGGSVAEALALTDLSALAELPVRLYSAGQRRRLALARVALSKAPLWLLDEPTNGLDAAAEAKLGGLIDAQRARGGMVIAASHLPLALERADELILG